MTYLEALQSAIEQTFSCKAKHLNSIPVKEVFQDKTAWEGIVEVFELIDHPKTAIAFGWGFEDKPGHTEFVTIPSIAQIVDPQTAVKAYLISQTK